MKGVLFTTIILVFIFSACKKTELVPGLIGRWELRYQSGGWGYDSTYVAGNGNIYQFNRDSTYKRYDKGALAAAGRFHIRHENSYQMQSVNSIFFDNDVTGDPISVQGTKLIMGTSVADGITSNYQKISN